MMDVSLVFIDFTSMEGVMITPSMSAGPQALPVQSGASISHYFQVQALTGDLQLTVLAAAPVPQPQP